MDAHLFSRFCEELAPRIIGGWLEKVQEPAPGAWFSLTTGRFALRPALAAADGQDEKNEALQGNKEAPSRV